MSDDCKRIVEDANRTSWRAQHLWEPGMDEESLLKMLAGAEEDPKPEFHLVPDPSAPRRMVEAIRAAVEVHRALGDPNARRVEIKVENGLLHDLCVESQEDAPTCTSIGILLSRAAFQTLTVKRHRGNNESVTLREHRPLRKRKNGAVR